MGSFFEVQSVFAHTLKPGDRIIQPVTSEEIEVATVTRARLEDRHNRWFDVRFVGTDEWVQLHEGDRVDLITEPTDRRP